MTPLDSVEGECLACVRGGRVVFRDIGFRLARGEALVVEGPNGSGKTSLLRMIAGLLPPAGGTLRVACEKDTADDGETRGKFIGWLGHHDSAKPHLSPGETLRFFAQLYRVGGGNIAPLLQSVGLSQAADLPCQFLSAGQKKRLALARLKLCGRPLWLLDEPLAALDRDGKSLLLDCLRSHLAVGGLAIIATHDRLDLLAANLRLT